MKPYFKNAIVINAPNSRIGISLEYQYIQKKLGAGWKPVMQALMKDGEKHYDQIKVKNLETGEIKTFYFDISSFFGKFW